jgi:hypothetical protein
MRISSGFIKMSSVIIVSSFIATAAMAGNYGVQVGAFKNVPSDLVNILDAFDEVTTIQGTSTTSIIVGQYNTFSEAKLVLAELADAGYTDAFVRDIDKARAQSLGKASSYSNTNATIGNYANESPFSSAVEKAKFYSLSPQEQRNAVILDGKLHLKQGDSFLPVTGSQL